MTNAERLAGLDPEELALRINQQIYRNGEAECVMECFASKLAAKIRCTQHGSCPKCIAAFLAEEED